MHWFSFSIATSKMMRMIVTTVAIEEPKEILMLGLALLHLLITTTKKTNQIFQLQLLYTMIVTEIITYTRNIEAIINSSLTSSALPHSATKPPEESINQSKSTLKALTSSSSLKPAIASKPLQSSYTNSCSTSLQPIASSSKVTYSFKSSFPFEAIALHVDLPLYPYLNLYQPFV